MFDFVNNPQQSAFGYLNILQWLSGRVAGLGVVDDNGRVEVYLRGNTNFAGGSNVQIYVDDIRVDADYLTGYPMDNVALIKVISGPSLAGGGNGAIVIYSKRGDEGPFGRIPGLPNNYLIGYKTQPPFFSPDYSIAQSRKVADARQTLFYGTPAQVGTTCRLRFYNNDTAKNFRVVVTGFDSTGKPVFMETLVE